MKLMVLDGNSIINRAFYGIRLLSTRDGLYTNAVYGFLAILNKLLDEDQPDALCVAFDLAAPTFRHLEYDGYKKHRKQMPDELGSDAVPKISALNFAIRLEDRRTLHRNIAGCAPKQGGCIAVTEKRRLHALANILGQAHYDPYGGGNEADTRNLLEQYALTRKMTICRAHGTLRRDLALPICEKTHGAYFALRRIDDIYADLDKLDIKEPVRQKRATCKAGIFSRRRHHNIRRAAAV